MISFVTAPPLCWNVGMNAKDPRRVILGTINKSHSIRAVKGRILQGVKIYSRGSLNIN